MDLRRPEDQLPDEDHSDVVHASGEGEVGHVVFGIRFRRDRSQWQPQLGESSCGVMPAHDAPNEQESHGP
jgi:hypothetical protein